MTNSSIRRKLTALRSLFSYLQIYSYSGANPAHGKFVAAPAVARDGKTVGLSPHDCRRLLDAAEGEAGKATPVDLRDRAMLAVLAHSGCRVGELVRLRVRDYKQSGEHRILNITGKGGRNAPRRYTWKRWNGWPNGWRCRASAIRGERCFLPPNHRAAWGGINLQTKP